MIITCPLTDVQLLVIHLFQDNICMNNPARFLVVSGLLLGNFPGFTQGTFQNLDFEQAQPVFLGYEEATTASALPYWTVSIGGAQQGVVGVNTYSTGASAVSLIGPGSLPPGSPVSGPIDGNYSVLLQNFGDAQTASLGQTGVIPTGTQSLEFKGFETFQNGGQVQVSVDSQSVPVTEIGVGPNYDLYAANISAWAGKNETISFTVGLAPLPYTVNIWELDDVTFSPNAVTATPEPSTLALTGLGGFFFALYRCLVAMSLRCKQ